MKNRPHSRLMYSVLVVCAALMVFASPIFAGGTRGAKTNKGEMSPRLQIARLEKERPGGRQTRFLRLDYEYFIHDSLTSRLKLKF